MSLFKAREWWHSQGPQAEEFDGGCLCVENIDNDVNGQVKIVTGSFQGTLRIYAPKERDYKAEDLLLEQVLEVDSSGYTPTPIPILQLEAGRFATSGGIHLAVLHPRKLAVYSCTSMGSHVQLTKLYEHWLEHTAANMCYGPFGGASHVDYLCVQSYDGQLSFYECELFAFPRFLPNFLIPGPITYCSPSDSFITCNAALELESYKYKMLAAASGEKVKEGSESKHQVVKRVQCDWKIILGESAINIRCGQLSGGNQPYQSDIVVLGEHHVFIANSLGQLTFQKRLDYHPACCITYPVPGATIPGGPENLIIITHTASALVYRGAMLSWAAKMETQPVAVRVIPYGQLQGMLVTLDESGNAVISFMGTDPMTNSIGFVEGKQLDYEAMARESRALAAIIREHSGGSRVEPPDKLAMRAQVPALLNNSRGGGGGDTYGGGRGGSSSRGSLTVKVYMYYQGGATYIDNVALTIKCPAPITCEEPNMVVPVVGSDSHDPVMVPITFIGSSKQLPTCTTAIVSASYHTPKGEPRAQSLQVELPLTLFGSIVEPVKNAAFKITLATNRTPPLITSVFEDMLAQAGPGMSSSLANNSAGANVISVQYHNGSDCTILVSKNGGRYRLQSDCFEAMWLMVQELHKRLATYYEEAEGGSLPAEGPFKMMFEDALPLEDFYEIMDAHFIARARASSLRKQLEDRAVQFRNIEKRLLMRFKDKNPAPLNQLDFLIEETYSGLMELGGLLGTAQEAVAAAAVKLSGAAHLILLLIRFKLGMTDKEYYVFKSYFSPEVIDGPEVGWEEHTEASMTQLLRSSLAKSAKEAAATIPPLSQVKDTTKLKKHLSLVLERLSKGMRIKVEEADVGPQQLAVANANSSTVGIPKSKRADKDASGRR